MSKIKMRNKDIIMIQTKVRSKPEFKATYPDAIQLSILEALLDIRDILDERMSKGVEVSGTVEEIIEEDLEKSITHSRLRPKTNPPTRRKRK